MKIIFVLPSIYGGGAERVVTLLSEHFVTKKIDVTIISNTYVKADYQVSSGVKVLPFFTTESQAKSKLSIFRQIRCVRREMKKNSDAIVVGVMPMMFLIVVIASFFLKNKIVASDHTSFERPLKWHINFIRKYVYKMADAVTVLTQADYDYIDKGLKNKFVLPNPLAFTPVASIKDGKQNKILAVGRLDVWYVKGFDILIDAWSRIADKHRNWILEIAGKGNEESLFFLQKLTEDLGVSESVLFSGFHNDIDRIMRESSIFALTSRHEGFGMVLIEAMSQGCSCVSFDCGGRQKEIITDSTYGIIVENHDVFALSCALDRLIDNEKLRLELAQNGMELVGKYNIDIIAQKWILMFQSLRA